MNGSYAAARPGRSAPSLGYLLLCFALAHACSAESPSAPPDPGAGAASEPSATNSPSLRAAVPPWGIVSNALSSAASTAAAATLAPAPGGAATNDEAACGPDAAGALFTQRIAPLFAEERPQSCNQCHLSGIDLGSFVRDDACESMACLVESGLVNLDAPIESTLLGWIERASPDSELITQAVIDEEYDGFLEWIEFSARCGQAVCRDVSCGPRDEQPYCVDEPLPNPTNAAGVPDDCDSRSQEALFKATVYAQRGRCSPCHVDMGTQEPSAGYPWIHVDGSCEQGSLQTLHDIDERGYMNLDEPARSLLLLKPLSGDVAHGGSAKFHDANDPTYQSILSFIEYHAQCKSKASESAE